MLIIEFLRTYFIYIFACCMFLFCIYIISVQRSIIETLNTRALNTEKVANTFYVPSVSGQWGEVQLKRIVELAGMLPHIEFATQKDISTGRPDMTINLPNKCVIYIDSKAPMSAYLNSINEPQNNAKWLKENAKSIKNHIHALSKREYWKSTTGPIFTIMFIPSEAVWLAALNQESNLLEYAADHNIIVTTPMGLLSLLKIIAYAWQNTTLQEKTTKTLALLAELKSFIVTADEEITSCISTITKHKTKLQTVQQILQTLREKLI